MFESDLIIQTLFVEPFVVILGLTQGPLVAGVIIQHCLAIELGLEEGSDVLLEAFGKSSVDGVEVILSCGLVSSVELFAESFGLVVDEGREVACALLFHSHK